MMPLSCLPSVFYYSYFELALVSINGTYFALLGLPGELQVLLDRPKIFLAGRQLILAGIYDLSEFILVGWQFVLAGTCHVF
jgi:hypothetical protein